MRKMLGPRNKKYERLGNKWLELGEDVRKVTSKGSDIPAPLMYNLKGKA